MTCPYLTRRDQHLTMTPEGRGCEYLTTCPIGRAGTTHTLCGDRRRGYLTVGQEGEKVRLYRSLNRLTLRDGFLLDRFTLRGVDQR